MYNKLINKSLKDVFVINRKNVPVFFVLLITSIISSLIILFDISRAIGTGYEILFLLPIGYIFFIVITKTCWNEIPGNIGLTVLFAIQFIRLVVAPLFVCLSNYHNIISLNASENNIYAIILMLYESLWISIFLNYNQKKRYIKYKDIDDHASNKRMNLAMAIVIGLTIIICYFAPEILKYYRTIDGLWKDDQFTNVEQSYIINQYSSSIFKKFMLVTANYILKVMRLLIPAYLMILLKKHETGFLRIISLLLVISPFLFVDGAIARSLYLTLFLLLLYNYLYKIDVKKMYFPIFLGGILVVIYFAIRYKYSNADSLTEYIADKTVDYFAGVNIVGGIFNLPLDIEARWHYFTLDIIRCIPFANTLFGLDSKDMVQPFFNQYNQLSGGQIPTTVGMGAYYFSVAFAPIYSAVFAVVCKSSGQKALQAQNPYYMLVYLYLSVICALGIGMYNIEITLGTIVQIILPIYIIARIAYPRIKGDVTIDT